jgi:hypothetical protein
MATARAQMAVGVDTLYGNEWINYGQTYYKLSVASDGIYRVTGADLLTAGLPIASIPAANLHLYRMGTEVSLFTTTNGLMGATDFLEFNGLKQRTELDAFLFAKGAADMVNTDYGLISDTSAYYLTWNTTPSSRRYQPLANNLVGVPAAEVSYPCNLTLAYNSDFHKPDIFGEASYSLYVGGEGYATPYLNTQALTVTPIHPIAGTVGRMNIRFGYDETYDYRTEMRINNVLVGIDSSSNQTTVKTASLALTASQLSSPIAFSSRVVAPFVTTKHNIGQIDLLYERSFDADNQTNFAFNINASAQVKYIEISNFNATGANPPILLDLTNGFRLVTTIGGGLIKIALPPSAQGRKLLLFNPQNTTLSTPLVLAPMSNISQDGGDYIIISSQRLMNDGAGHNRVQEYADYRSSTSGGGYRTKIIDIQNIYNQFGYGVQRHPQSVRNFINFVAKRWANPKYVVLVGKGRYYTEMRNGASIMSPNNVSYDVPTWGYPASDNLLAASLKSNIPAIPIGRIAATKPDDIKIYLDKVKGLENLQANGQQTLLDKDWAKNVMHLSGGEGFLAQGISLYLKGMERYIKAPMMGASLTTFYKNSTSPVSTPLNDLIFDRINKGVSVITFFGHSAASTLDFNIDNPSYLTNTNKYPVFYALGCSSGDVHTSSQGVSEHYVFYKDKGAIAFVASSGLSYDDVLDRFQSACYQLLSGADYSKGIGDIQRDAIRLLENPQTLPTQACIFQQMTLNGDPAIRINTAKGPDYLPLTTSVKTIPTTLSTQLDSFKLSFDVLNLGKALPDTLNILIEQQLPSGVKVLLINTKIGSPAYSTTLTYSFPMQGKQAAGQNRILVKVNANNAIGELPNPTAFQNNDLIGSDGLVGFPIYIFDVNAKPVYPSEFAIVNAPPTLKAATANAITPSRKYVMELDTTALFNSPNKLQYSQIQGGGTISWQPNQSWQANRVYYWRISPDSISTAGYAWETSSFIYMPTSSLGWNQSHLYQFKRDKFNDIDLPDSTRRFKFVDIYGTVNARAGNPAFGNDRYPQFDFNGSYSERYRNELSGIMVVLFDSLTTAYTVNQSGDYGSFVSGYNTRKFLYSTDNAANRQKAVSALRDSIPNGTTVLVMTCTPNAGTSFYPEQWAADSAIYGTSLFKLLEQNGATRVRQLQTLGSMPYIFAYRKGFGYLGEAYTNKKDSLISIEIVAKGNWNKGFVETPIIGPVRSWDTMTWRFLPSIHPSSDTISVSVIGYKATGGQDTLVIRTTRSTVSLANISAITYPYLKLRLESQNEQFRLMPQLDFWRINYHGLPDAAINPNIQYSFYKDTLQQGDKAKITLGVENITGLNMDSLLVKFSTIDNNNVERVSYARYKPLAAGQSLIASSEMVTTGLSGNQKLTVEVNPNNDQAELSHYNNIAQTQFFVQRDNKNPLLDVTFDGQHILNGDIVSPSPSIIIALKDENKYLALTDTAIFQVSLKSPDGSINRVWLDGGNARFFPALSADRDNRARIEYNPKSLKDGIYQLIVKGKDASGNSSGSVDYLVSFQVINKSMLSNVLNYPNPFSTATQFVYTLTGTEIPNYFNIQIMTVSGKIVREITQDEIGPLRIGTHRTDYVWNGTDTYGEKLSVGVYLYRIIAKKKSGDTFDTYKTATDNLFQQGFGKLVIIR